MGWRKAYPRGANTVIPFPTGFTWTTAPITVYRNAKGKIETDFNVTTFKYNGAAGKIYYVDYNNGNDTNNGLTSGTALKKLRTALNKADVDIVMIAGGVYPRSFGTFGDITKSVSIISYNGEAVISMHEDLAWSLSAGQQKTYQANRANVVSVYDSRYKDGKGDYLKFTQKASTAEVEANPGSFYFDSVANIVYVQMSDSRVPDTDIRAYLLFNNKVTGATTCYLEGISFESGGSPLWPSTVDGVALPSVYAKNCKFKYGLESNGIRAEGATVYLQNCEAARNLDDGFNYHIKSAVNCKVIEVNCVGRDNGLSADTDNGSTMHDGGKIIRVNGVYYGNVGPNVADVNDNTESWNLGCFGFNSKAVAANQNTDFTQDSASKVWLDTCASFSSSLSLQNRSATSQTYVKGNRFEGTESVTGTKTAY